MKLSDLDLDDLKALLDEFLIALHADDENTPEEIQRIEREIVRIRRVIAYKEGNYRA